MLAITHGKKTKKLQESNKQINFLSLRSDASRTPWNDAVSHPWLGTTLTD